MPGFTSFLLGHGRGQHPSQNFRTTTTTFDHDYDSEHDYKHPASRTQRLQQARRHAAQVTYLYDTTITRGAVEKNLTLLKALKSSLRARIEDFHDMGIMGQRERGEAIALFRERMKRIFQAGSVAVYRFRRMHGQLRELCEGLGALGRVVRDGEGGEMGMEDVRSVVGIYQWKILGPLRGVIQVVEGVLGTRAVWADGE